MVWSRTVLDGILLCLIFILTVAVTWIFIPGAEHCKAWETKEWMKTLAIPEHLIGWPLVVCPLVGFIVAGISTWVY